MAEISRREYDNGHSRFEVVLHKPPVAQVDLIAFTGNASQAIGKVTLTYSGKLLPEEVSQETIEKAMDDLRNTKLLTPLEMIYCIFLIRDVTRAFTHQLVRYRIGTAYAQESMRFLGTKSEYKVLVTEPVYNNDIGYHYYEEAVCKSIENYELLHSIGIPSEDARGTLPTNILTSIFFSCSLRTLQNIVTQRLCCQAQKGEWTGVILGMRKEVRSKMGEDVASILKAPVELEKPCGYNASFDRPCIWKNGIVEDV